MDRRGRWSKKKTFQVKFEKEMARIENEKNELREKNRQLRRIIECRQNAIHLAAAVLIQIEAKDDTITNVKECNGCDQCDGTEGCYIVEVLK